MYVGCAKSLTFALCFVDFLSFVSHAQANEKIYLLKRLTEEWYMGRDKRGLEGMFPVNYVEVKVPLVDEQSNESVTRLIPATSDNGGGVKVRALYNFKAEAPEDLTIMVCFAIAHQRVVLFLKCLLFCYFRRMM